MDAASVIVWWLMIGAGMAKTPLVIVPEPFLSEAHCLAAGEAFKASKLDYEEMGGFACIPQPRAPQGWE